jgi:hypothetical protein
MPEGTIDMLEFRESVFIQQPIKTVFAFVTDPNNNSQWQTGVLEVELTSIGPIGPGATYRCVNKFLGQQIETGGIICEYKTDERCTFKFTSGQIAGESSYIFDTVTDGTRFTTTGALTLGLSRPAEWMACRIARTQIIQDLKRLKQILENGNGRKSC